MNENSCTLSPKKVPESIWKLGFDGGILGFNTQFMNVYCKIKTHIAISKFLTRMLFDEFQYLALQVYL